MSKKLDVICALLKSLLNLPIFKSFRRVNPEILVNFRRILLDMFCKKGVLKNFAKFTRKHLSQRLSFNEIAGLRLSAGK